MQLSDGASSQTYAAGTVGTVTLVTLVAFSAANSRADNVGPAVVVGPSVVVTTFFVN